MLAVIVGGFAAAYGLEAVLIPNSVSDGGETGLSIVGSELFHVPLGILIALLNVPVKTIRHRLGRSAAIGTVEGKRNIH